MVETGHSSLTIARQCEILHIQRSSFYYEPRGISDYDFTLRLQIDKIFTNVSSSYGYRMMHQQLIEDGYTIGVNKVARLMNNMGLEAIHPKKKRQSFDKGTPEADKYPYLLSQYHNDKKQVVVYAPNEVWSSDITYIPIKGGHMYLSAHPRVVSLASQFTSLSTGIQGQYCLIKSPIQWTPLLLRIR
jgi:putative transposase